MAVISISTPVGCEALPAAAALPLVDAYNEGIDGAWCVARAGGCGAFAAAVARRVRARRPPASTRGSITASSGCPCRPSAIATAGGVEQAGPLLEVLEAARPAALRASRARPRETPRDPAAGEPAGVVDVARPVPGVVAARVLHLAGGWSRAPPGAAHGVGDHGRRGAVSGAPPAACSAATRDRSTRTCSSTPPARPRGARAHCSRPTAPNRWCTAATTR